MHTEERHYSDYYSDSLQFRFRSGLGIETTLVFAYQSWFSLREQSVQQLLIPLTMIPFWLGLLSCGLGALYSTASAPSLKDGAGGILL